MTYHSHSSWTFDDEFSDAVVDEIVMGLQYNKEYNSGERYTPDAYWTSCSIDSLIFNIGKLLDRFERRDESITPDVVEKLAVGAPESVKVVVLKVFEKLGVLNE